MSEMPLNLNSTFEGVGRLCLGDATENFSRPVLLQLSSQWLGSGQLMPPLPAAGGMGCSSRVHKAALCRGSLLSTW